MILEPKQSPVRFFKDPPAVDLLRVSSHSSFTLLDSALRVLVRPAAISPTIRPGAMKELFRPSDATSLVTWPVQTRPVRGSGSIWREQSLRAGRLGGGSSNAPIWQPKQINGGLETGCYENWWTAFASVLSVVIFSPESFTAGCDSSRGKKKKKNKKKKTNVEGRLVHELLSKE